MDTIKEDQKEIIGIDKSLIKETIYTFGKYKQLLKLIEELNELSVVISKLLSCNTEEEKELIENKIYDEIADVKIMLAQAEEIFNIDKINERVKYKMKRLKKFLAEL